MSVKCRTAPAGDPAEAGQWNRGPRPTHERSAARQNTRKQATPSLFGDQRPLVDPAAISALSAFEAHRTTVGIAPKVAAQLAGVSQQTIIRWIAKYSIGYKVAGRYIVDRERLAILLAGGIQ